MPPAPWGKMRKENACMKMKRMVASVLTLLLVVSILPIGAMADDLPNNTISQATITQPIGTNSGAGVGITETGSVQTNEGSVRKNKGTVVNNDGKVVDNMSGGTVVNNNAGGTVEFNAAGGTIETNNGTVGDQRPDGFVQPTSGNHGTVETNNAGGKVLINQSTGTIETNYGLVGRKDGDQLVTDDDTGNFGTVTTNYGTITQNKKLVVTNAKNYDTTIPGNIYINDGTVKNNEGYVTENKGTVGTNNGMVWNNHYTVGTNNGTVSDNHGTVDTNNYLITDNYKDVGTNNRDISTNRGTVDTNNGSISDNYGIVKTNAIDGRMNNFNIGAAAVASNADADSTKEEPVVNGVGTNFGTVVDHQGIERITYYGLSWGDSVDNLTSIKSFVEDGTEGINLNDYAAKASRSGYKMTGFTAFARKNGTDTKITDTANHTMNAPVWLQILWEKLGGKSEAQPTRTPVYTKLSAEQVKIGMFVRCGKMTFKIIEVTDDSIRVATVGKLSDEALADMLGFLKQHLSDAQIAKLIGAPELLEEELVAKFFGGRYEHIAFYASADLFA